MPVFGIGEQWGGIVCDEIVHKMDHAGPQQLSGLAVAADMATLSPSTLQVQILHGICLPK